MHLESAWMCCTPNICERPSMAIASSRVDHYQPNQSGSKRLKPVQVYRAPIAVPKTITHPALSASARVADKLQVPMLVADDYIAINLMIEELFVRTKPLFIDDTHDTPKFDHTCHRPPHEKAALDV